MASDHKFSSSTPFFRKFDIAPTGPDVESRTGAPGAELPPPPASQAWRDRVSVVTALLIGAVLAGAFTGGIAAFGMARNALLADRAALANEIKKQANEAEQQANKTEKLKQQVAQLIGELAELKIGADSADRATLQRFAKLGERLEKSQDETMARIARVGESIDRLERRVAAAPDITGAVTTIEKQSDKPPEVEGWKLRKYDGGRAMVQSRSGQLFYVRPGTNIPGVGKIETIKRVEGHVIITTPKGVITSSLEPPQPSLTRANPLSGGQISGSYCCSR